MFAGVKNCVFKTRNQSEQTNYLVLPLDGKIQDGRKDF